MQVIDINIFSIANSNYIKLYNIIIWMSHAALSLYDKLFKNLATKKIKRSTTCFVSYVIHYTHS